MISYSSVPPCFPTMDTFKRSHAVTNFPIVPGTGLDDRVSSMKFFCGAGKTFTTPSLTNFCRAGTKSSQGRSERV